MYRTDTAPVERAQRVKHLKRRHKHSVILRMHKCKIGSLITPVINSITTKTPKCQNQPKFQFLGKGGEGGGGF